MESVTLHYVDGTSIHYDNGCFVGLRDGNEISCTNNVDFEEEECFFIAHGLIRNLVEDSDSREEKEKRLDSILYLLKKFIMGNVLELHTITFGNREKR